MHRLLGEVLSRAIPDGYCLTCAVKPATWAETATPQRVFCHESCQADYHRLIQAWVQLGGKTAAGEFINDAEALQIFALPEDLQLLILRLRYPYCETDEYQFLLLTRWIYVDRYGGQMVRRFFAHMTGLPPKIDRLLTYRQVHLFPRLQRLNLATANATIDDEALASLSQMRTLVLNTNRLITSHGVSRLVNLVSLSLAGNEQIDDACLRALPALTELNLETNAVITDGGVMRLTNLTALGLKGNTTVTGVCFVFLAKLTTLRLDHCRSVTSAALATVTGLTTLTLSGVNQIDANCLASLTKLTTLSLSANERDLSGGLRALTGLTNLNMAYCNMVAYNDTLPFLTGLVVLDVSRNIAIDSETLGHLTSLTTLYSPSQLSGAALRQLVNLRTVHLQNTLSITDADLSALHGLTRLVLGHNKSITDRGLASLTNLEKLDLKENTVITDAALHHLPALTSLVLTGNKRITDAGLRAVSGLQRLSLQQNYKITTLGLQALPHLQVLTISEGRVTQELLEALPQQCRIRETRW